MPPSIKSAKLVKNVQDLQAFLIERLPQNSKVQPLLATLKAIEQQQQSGHLSLQVLSYSSASAATLQHHLSDRLPKLYQILPQPESFPTNHLSIPELPPVPATLNYYPLTESATQQTHQLPLSTKTRIGRDPSSEISLKTEWHPCISWHHAEITAIAPTNGNATPTWVLKDLDSRSGVYINDNPNRIQGSHILQAGDRITLPASEELHLELQFECQSIEEAADQVEVDFDVLCLVLESDQSLLDAEKKLLNAIQPGQPTQVILVSNTAAHLTQSQLPTEIMDQFPHLQCKCLAIDLSNPEEISSSELEDLINILEVHAQRKPEDKLAERLTYQVRQHIQQIEALLDLDEANLKRQIQRETTKLPHEAAPTVKPSKLFKNINEERNRFFKRCRVLLGRSKVALLDEFSPYSIPYKLQTFLDDLRVVEFKRNGQKRIRLESKHTSNQNLHLSLMQFCQDELSQWVTDEYERIKEGYDGGLSQVFHTIQSRLILIPDLANAPVNWQSDFDHLSLTRSIQDAVTEFYPIACHPSPSVGSYILKSLRTQWMTFGITLSMIAVLGLPMQGKSAFSSALTWMAKQLTGRPLALSPMVANFLVLSLLLLPLSIVLICSYLDDKQSKVEKEASNLRKEMGNHYQRAIARLVEKIMQDINDALDTVERQLDDGLEALEQMAPSLDSAKVSRSTSEKSNLEKLKNQQKEIQETRSALQKIKRFL